MNPTTIKYELHAVKYGPYGTKNRVKEMKKMFATRQQALDWIDTQTDGTPANRTGWRLCAIIPR